MALGSVVGSLAAGAASSLGGRLFGGSSSRQRVRAPQINTALPGISAGGLIATASPQQVGVTSNANRQGIVGGLSGTFGEQADLLAGQRALVAPGVSDLRASRLANVENARTRAIGNLRQNLQRRRVLGSSFGRDALTRAEAEFSQERDRVEAESALQELQLTNQLINQEFQARAQSFQTRLDELNVQADLAEGIRQSVASDLNQNAQLQARLSLGADEFNARTEQAAAQGAGQFFGQAFAPLQTGISDFFNNRSRLRTIGSNLANSTVVS